MYTRIFWCESGTNKQVCNAVIQPSHWSYIVQNQVIWETEWLRQRHHSPCYKTLYHQSYIIVHWFNTRFHFNCTFSHVLNHLHLRFRQLNGAIYKKSWFWNNGTLGWCLTRPTIPRCHFLMTQIMTLKNNDSKTPLFLNKPLNNSSHIHAIHKLLNIFFLLQLTKKVTEVLATVSSSLKKVSHICEDEVKSQLSIAFFKTATYLQFLLYIFYMKFQSKLVVCFHCQKCSCIHCFNGKTNDDFIIVFWDYKNHEFTCIPIPEWLMFIKLPLKLDHFTYCKTCDCLSILSRTKNKQL